MNDWEFEHFIKLQQQSGKRKEAGEDMSEKLPRDIAVYSDTPQARHLAQTMGMFQRRDFSDYADGKPKIIVNWGHHNLPALPGESIILNKAAAVSSVYQQKPQLRWATNGIRVAETTNDLNKVINELIEGRMWYGHLSSSNPSPVFYDKKTSGPFMNSQTFTRYIKPKEQYRLHFLHKELIATQKRVQVKQLADGTPVPTERFDPRFRSFATGWDLENIEEAPFHIQIEASRAFKTTQLDFGSIEIIDDGTLGYVVTATPAPHLNEGLTKKYGDAFKKLLTKAA